MAKIMIIEDDEIIREELRELLEKAGYEVILINKFENLVQKILKISPDLLLLDINIPLVNGEIILQELRKKSNLAIVMVTSKNNEVDEALSISYGADDYITKPYNPNILLLRIGAVLKRSRNYNNELIYKDLIFDMGKGTIKKEDKEIILTKNEMIIFSYLMMHQNKIVSRDELMTILWDNTEFVNDNTLTVNISRLRNKLKELGKNYIIETRKGQGYILS